MHVAQTLLKHVFGSNPRPEMPANERFTRFENPTAEPGESHHSAKHVLELNSIPEIKPIVPHQPVQPKFAQADEPEFQMHSYRRFETNHTRTPTPKRAPSPVVSEHQMSNEGASDIPLSVLRTALGRRLGYSPRKPQQRHVMDEFVFEGLARN